MPHGGPHGNLTAEDAQAIFGGDDTYEESDFLGVPRGYTAEQTVTRRRPASRWTPSPWGRMYQAQVRVPPAFQKGSEWQPAGQKVEDRARLQREMLAAGVFTPEETKRLKLDGRWTDLTRNAYKRLLSFANAAGISDVGQALAGYAESAPDAEDLAEFSPDVIGGGVYQGGRYTVNLTSPEEIRALTDRIAQTSIGRRATVEEQAELVTAIQGRERAAEMAEIEASERHRLAGFEAERGQQRREVETRRAVEQGGGGAPPIAANLQALIDAAPGKITVTDLVRTPQQQADLKRRKPKLAAAPGQSKHETGEAADLEYENKAVEKWAHANAARFGLRFPMLGGKGKKNEPWHVELPGPRGSHAFGGAVSGDGGIVEVPPVYMPAAITTATRVDPEAIAQEELARRYPAEVRTHRLLEGFDVVAEMIGAR